MVDGAKFAREGRRDGWYFNGIDVRGVLNRFMTLPVFTGAKRPALKIVWSAVDNHSVRGTAWTRSCRIRIRIGPNADIAGLLELVLHELVHTSLPPGEHHGDRFILRLARAAREAWGIEVEHPLSVEIGTSRLRAYAVDKIITTELRKLFGERPELIPAATQPPAKTLAEKRADAIKTRAERAMRLLARAEADLARAQKRASKWRMTVRYYDRAAAKRGDR